MYKLTAIYNCQKPSLFLAQQTHGIVKDASILPLQINQIKESQWTECDMIIGSGQALLPSKCSICLTL